MLRFQNLSVIQLKNLLKNESRNILKEQQSEKKIVAAILKKPKKFFGISEDMILKFMSKQEFTAKVRVVVQSLTDSKRPSQIEATVFEFEDERLLRGK